MRLSPLLNILILILLASCRGGHFESIGERSLLSRLKIELRENNLKICESQIEGKTCLALHLSFVTWDRVERQEVEGQTWDFRLHSDDGQLLDSASLRASSSGELQWSREIEVDSEGLASSQNFVLEISTQSYEPQLFQFEVNLSKAENAIQNFQALASWDDFVKPSSSHRNLDWEILNAELLKREPVSPEVELITLRFSFRLSDTQSEQALARFPLHYEAIDSLSGKINAQTVFSDAHGVFSVRCELQKNLFSNESQRKIRINLTHDGKRYPNQFAIFLIINLQNELPLVETALTTVDLISDEFWRDHSVRFASESPPRLLLDDLRIVELPTAESYFVSRELQLIRVRRFLLDFHLFLEGKSESGPELQSLNGQKLRIWAGRTKLLPDQLRPDVWEKRTKFTLNPTEAGTYSFALDINEEIRPSGTDEDFWMLLESSLFDINRIPPSYHLIAWPAGYYKNLPSDEMEAHSIRVRPHRSAERIERYEREKFGLPSRLQQVVEALLGDKDPQSLRPSTSDLFRWLLNRAIEAGLEVEQTKTWDAYKEHRVLDVLEDRLVRTEVISDDLSVFHFEIRVKAQTCVSFLNKEEILSACNDEPVELNEKIAFLVRKSYKISAHRLLKNAGDLSTYREPSWLPAASLLYMLDKGFRPY